jgi:DNA polymerase-3 subunit delta'
MTMKFSEVVGHNEIKQKLIHAVQNGRIPHAQLFLGQEGGGNLALAISYAQYVNCTQRTSEDSCGSCPSCVKYQHLQHPDLHFCFPIIGSDKTSDHFMPEFHQVMNANPYTTYIEWMEKISDSKSGLMNVLQANEIVKKLSLRPYEAAYQVMIIWMPETMNTPTANKLLKTIEEPPDRSLIILVANNDEEMLSTILSRVQYIKLKKLQDMDMLAALTSRFELPFDKAREIVNVADGNYRYALRLVEMEDMDEDTTKLLQDWFRSSYAMDIGKLTQVVDTISKLSREKQKSFYEYAIHIFRQALAMNNAEEVMRVTTNERQFLDKFSSVTQNHKLPKLIEKLEKSVYYVDRNANGKILAMNLSMDLYESLKLEKHSLS